MLLIPRSAKVGVVSFHVKTTRETYPLRKYYIQTIGATPINQSLYVVFEDVAERLIMLYSSNTHMELLRMSATDVLSSSFYFPDSSQLKKA